MIPFYQLSHLTVLSQKGHAYHVIKKIIRGIIAISLHATGIDHLRKNRLILEANSFESP